MVPTGLVGRALELESKQQQLEALQCDLPRPLLFTKRDACERQMDLPTCFQAHFLPRPGCVHDVLVALVWV